MVCNKREKINRMQTSNQTNDDSFIVSLRIILLAILIGSSLVTKSPSNSAGLVLMAIGWGLWTIFKTVTFLSEKKTIKSRKMKSKSTKIHAHSDETSFSNKTVVKDITENTPESAHSSIMERKKLYPNEFYAWTKEEDKDLRTLVNKHKTISELSVFFERSSDLIKERIKKLSNEKGTKKYISKSKTTPKSKHISSSNKTYIKNNLDTSSIDKYGIEYLYHITHIKNLSNIFQYGLKSHNVAHSKKYNVEDISNKEVNKNREKLETIYQKQVHDYVPLFFNPLNVVQWAVSFKVYDYVILGIDKKILLSMNTLFTDGNAANRDTKFYNDLRKLSKLKWNCINSNDICFNGDERRVKCAEVLVYPEIKIQSIKKIFCKNEELKNKVIDILDNNLIFDLEIKKSLFTKTGIIGTYEFEIDD
jgi:hypothetical protein